MRMIPIFSLFIWLFFLNVAIANDADDTADNSSIDRTPVYRIDHHLELTSETTYHNNKKMNIKSVYPQLSNDAFNEEDEENVDHFNQLITEIVQDEITKFKNQSNNLHFSKHNMPKSLPKSSLFIDYDTSVIKSEEDHLISIRFTMQAYITGMAHPYHYHRVFNFNLESDQEIQLSDLFIPGSDYLSLLSNYCREVLSRRLANKQMIASGTTPQAENFALWNIKPTGILITFEEANVAPYVNGAQTVLVPYSILMSMIPPDSPVAFCAEHPKKCVANKLFTGGFIDEALIKTQHRAFNPLFS